LKDSQLAKNKNNPPSKKETQQQTTDQQENHVSVLAHRQISFLGPLPPPQILSQYNEIDPSFAERIVCMAENQAAHRQEQEKKELEAGIECEKWRVKAQGVSALAGLVSGFILCSVALGGGIWCVLKGYQFGGGFIGGGGLIGLAAVFVYGSKLKTKEEK
jgi:uncharacterized membrane protein